MPKYFFQVTQNGKAAVPEEALELANMDAAWEEATKTCGELIKDIDGSFEIGTDWSIEVQDEFRKPIRTITVSARSNV